ncbi:porin [Moritella viscosa]|uniref:porin n=1 Tax=Moritella viscosa TaxID=80854 RepID=UPI000918ACFA|nr:porin [Moritella viscosa]SGY93852.1 Outer membrane protein [Moritella viscosa]
MKYSTLALTLASILSVGAASAATIYKNENGDNLKIYGGMEIGGTFVSDTDKTPFGSDSTYVDDSFMTIGAKGSTGDFYAKFELDAERQDWTNDNNIRLVVDKAYVGYKLTAKQSIEFGRTDTAYDHYDAFGDVTNELGAGISEAGDQDNTLKYRGQFGNIKVGISHSLEGWDGTTAKNTSYIVDNSDPNNIIVTPKVTNTGEPKKYSYETDSLYGQVTNGYIGYFGDDFTILVGAESGDETEIYSLHSQVKLGDFTVSGLVWDQTKNFNKDESSEKNIVGANIGTKYKLTEKLSLLASVNYEDLDNVKASKEDYKSEWLVVGGEYKYAKNVKLAAEVSIGDVLKNGESGALGYVKAYYWF